MINFFIIQPSLVSADQIDIRIFGIKVKSEEVGQITKEKQIGYVVLNYVISGLCALAIVLVVLFFCCIFIYCSSKGKADDEERGMPGYDDYESDDESERNVGDEKPERTEEIQKSEGTKTDEEDE
ncbi:hypothetical protein RclHR1_02280007 [Rhizophagus clarus]|uniref:Uncharacterized protein n=1 Tax=Rhizophagus clarus TaxID=94130 RepID=A0A2Z6R8B7_9GLOM|nr:hypothetical protein RclHR1_02280007 [Rhizophagus clarus]